MRVVLGQQVGREIVTAEGRGEEGRRGKGKTEAMMI